MKTKRICLWSGPRNVSTALMYAFAQRSNTHVIDEPFYAHYLHTKYGPHTATSTHPGTAEVLASMTTDADQVIREVILGPCDSKVLFIKHMAHHLIQVDLSFLQHTANVLLVRDPKEMLLSLAKVIGTPTLADTGLKAQYDLFHELRAGGQSVPVLDARFLLEGPASVLRQLCEQLGLRFETSMLSWKAGGNPADGVWARYWYTAVHRSTGFEPYRPKSEPFPPELSAVLAACSTYYDALHHEAIAPQ